MERCDSRVQFRAGTLLRNAVRDTFEAGIVGEQVDVFAEWRAMLSARLAQLAQLAREQPFLAQLACSSWRSWRSSRASWAQLRTGQFGALDMVRRACHDSEV